MGLKCLRLPIFYGPIVPENSQTAAFLLSAGRMGRPEFSAAKPLLISGPSRSSMLPPSLQTMRALESQRPWTVKRSSTNISPILRMPTTYSSPFKLHKRHFRNYLSSLLLLASRRVEALHGPPQSVKLRNL